MPRLSIDLTEDEHRRLKASAALAGSTLKDYVLARALAAGSEAKALEELGRLLQPRIEAARNGDISKRTITEIARTARAKRAR